jgi:hypothetical protein
MLSRPAPGKNKENPEGKADRKSALVVRRERKAKILDEGE